MSIRRYSIGTNNGCRRQQKRSASCLDSLCVRILLTILFFSCFLYFMPSIRKQAAYAYSAHRRLPPPTLVSHVRSVLKNYNATTTCMHIASGIKEPYTSEYYNRTVDIDGIAYTYSSWTGRNKKKDIQIQKTDTFLDCRMAMKIKDDRLFIHTQNYCYRRIQEEKGSLLDRRLQIAIELTLLAIEMFDVPDVDFVINFSDTEDIDSHEGQRTPVISPCLSHGKNPQEGFTYPSEGSYIGSLGKEQMRFYHECIRQRYPPSQQIPKAVWRGSTTGPWLNALTDVLKNRRLSLAFLGKHLSNILDVGVIHHVQVNETDKEVVEAVGELGPIVGYMSREHYNRYALVVDIDGNGWSDRVPFLLMGHAPLLKQRSIWIESFGHLLKDHREVNYFKEDLSDFVLKVSELVKRDPITLQEAEIRVQTAFEFAQEYLSHTGVIRAMAYTLKKQASLMSWKVRDEDEYEYIPRSTCCKLNPSLPEELIATMRRS